MKTRTITRITGTIAASGMLLLLPLACGSDPEVEASGRVYSIGGTITKSDGGAAFDATILLQDATTGSDTGQTTVDATGAYLFAGVPAGVYRITVTLAGYETATIIDVDARDGDASGADAVLQKIAVPVYTVSGVITTPGGGAAGATVKLFNAADNTLASQPTTTGADGAYTIPAIPAGEYTLVVTLDGHEAGVFNVTVDNAPLNDQNFTLQPATASATAIRVLYSGTTATVENLPPDGTITASTSGADVTIATASTEFVEFTVSGSTPGGSLKIQNNVAAPNQIRVTLDNATITSATKLPPIQVTKNEGATIIELKGTNLLADHPSNEENATLISKSGSLEFEGHGTLAISGAAKHAIASSKKSITVRGGDITVTSAASDGFHAEAGYLQSGGTLTISATGDAIDAGTGTAVISGGNLLLTVADDDTKGIKSDDNLTINGGVIAMTVPGKQSKGLSSKQDITINDGKITIETSGAPVLDPSGSGHDPSYCTAIKADGKITVAGGTITITSLATAAGGKGLSAGGDIAITGGTIHVTTAGAGAVYTNANGATDSYTPACITSDAGITVTAGTLTLASSGPGGKCISADGTITIGTTGGDNGSPVITATTTGARFLVTGGTGGGRPGMDDASDYANPKIIKSEGNLTVNSGTLRLTGTTDGGEGLESKATLTINGGYLEIRTLDDCLNAATRLLVNGGTIHARATGNDALDSNGDILVTGGTLVVQGSEEGLDSDNTPVQVNGGTVVATSGQSMGARFTGTQACISVNAAASSAIGVRVGNEWALLFQLPAASTGGSPGGNRGTLAVIISLPRFTTGTTGTLHTGGSITGGTTTAFGYNTGGTYSGGSSKSFSIN